MIDFCNSLPLGYLSFDLLETPIESYDRKQAIFPTLETSIPGMLDPDPSEGMNHSTNQKNICGVSLIQWIVASVNDEGLLERVIGPFDIVDYNKDCIKCNGPPFPP